MCIQHYVLGFLFSPSGEEVVLIQKTKPTWQKGKLNGVGGKIEFFESSEEAMRREFKEETDLDIDFWKHVATMGNKEYSPWMCDVYMAISSRYSEVITTTEEQVTVIKVSELNNHPIIPNLRYLIPLALYAEGLATIDVY